MTTKPDFGQRNPNYDPKGYRDLGNTLGSFLPAGLGRPELGGQTIGQFQAQKMLESGFVVVHSPEVAEEIWARAVARGDIT